MTIYTGSPPQRQPRRIRAPYTFDIYVEDVSPIEARRAARRLGLLECACTAAIAAERAGKCTVRIILPLSRRPDRAELSRVLAYVLDRLDLDAVPRRELTFRVHADAEMLAYIGRDPLSVDLAIALAPLRECVCTEVGQA